MKKIILFLLSFFCFMSMTYSAEIEIYNAYFWTDWYLYINWSWFNNYDYIEAELWNKKIPIIDVAEKKVKIWLEDTYNWSVKVIKYNWKQIKSSNAISISTNDDVFIENYGVEFKGAFYQLTVDFNKSIDKTYLSPKIFGYTVWEDYININWDKAIIDIYLKNYIDETEPYLVVELIYNWKMLWDVWINLIDQYEDIYLDNYEINDDEVVLTIKTTIPYIDRVYLNSQLLDEDNDMISISNDKIFLYFELPLTLYEYKLQIANSAWFSKTIYFDLKKLVLPYIDSVTLKSWNKIWSEVTIEWWNFLWSNKFTYITINWKKYSVSSENFPEPSYEWVLYNFENTQSMKLEFLLPVMLNTGSTNYISILSEWKETEKFEFVVEDKSWKQIFESVNIYNNKSDLDVTYVPNLLTWNNSFWDNLSPLYLDFNSWWNHNYFFSDIRFEVELLEWELLPIQGLKLGSIDGYVIKLSDSRYELAFWWMELTSLDNSRLYLNYWFLDNFENDYYSFRIIPKSLTYLIYDDIWLSKNKEIEIDLDSWEWLINYISVVNSFCFDTSSSYANCINDWFEKTWYYYDLYEWSELKSNSENKDLVAVDDENNELEDSDSVEIDNKENWLDWNLDPDWWRWDNSEDSINDSNQELIDEYNKKLDSFMPLLEKYLNSKTWWDINLTKKYLKEIMIYLVRVKPSLSDKKVLLVDMLLDRVKFMYNNL